MLLTITSTAVPATDLGFLLHKHPGKVQDFDVPVGRAHVFYPEATEGRCTAALFVEVDAVGLVRGRRPAGPEAFSLAQYVNDRPYAASSMLAVALSRVFRSAMAGRCDALAGEGATYHDRDHGWHLALADRLAAAAPDLIRTTRRLVVDTTDPDSTAAGISWWEELTGSGGEGMVVKPYANLHRTPRGLAQPGIKVRGREYLRIIYGPDYTEPANLDRLRRRNLGRKRSLALREYALGLEALERVARGEPLWRIHEPVFAVLALESEPVDPRL
ncbi:hypothetical protein ACPPVO_39190 [Dactylosporangium sp. McL0621]|uniref:hypothetical protein n=1 Tax=Dactylosporangium sp. McL0621 TaxID=3415678 RepID=UPI003CFBB4CC